MRLYCVKPYRIPGGLFVVAANREAALRLVRNTPGQSRSFQEGVDPFLEAHEVGLDGLEGPERVVCALKGLLQLRLPDGSRRSDTTEAITLRTEPPVSSVVPMTPPRGQLTLSAQARELRKKLQPE